MMNGIADLGLLRGPVLSENRNVMLVAKKCGLWRFALVEADGRDGRRTLRHSTADQTDARNHG
jgi:hypothetical protein